MNDHEARLRRSAESLRTELQRIPTPGPPTRSRLRVGRMAGVTAVAAMVVTALILASPPVAIDTVDSRGVTDIGSLPAPSVPASTAPSTPPRTMPANTTTPNPAPVVSIPASGPTFAEDTGMVMLFDDGLEGLTAFDPDRRLVARSAVDGQRPGDEPYSMTRIGNALVVGWSEIYAVDIPTREPTLLGEATIYVPAAEDDRVWLLDYPSGRITGRPRVWQVDLAGQPLTEPVETPLDGFPLIGIPGGLAVQTNSGLTLWNLEGGTMDVLAGEGPGFVLDSAGNELVWCSGGCTELVITNTSTLESERFTPPTGYDRFWPTHVSPSPQGAGPGGRWLAALVGSSTADDGEALWLLDRESGETTVMSDPATTVTYVAWAPGGDQVFASSYSYGLAETTVWRYDLTDARFSAVVVPFGGAIAPVVIDGSHRDAYIGDPDLEGGCGPSVGASQGRSDLCTFGF